MKSQNDMKTEIDITRHYVPITVSVSMLIGATSIIWALSNTINDVKIDMIDRINNVAEEVYELKGAINKSQVSKE